MSAAAATRFGVYHSHLRKGREVLVTIALPETDGEALVQDLGQIPTRYKKIAVAVGAIAETLDELLASASAPDDPPATAEGFSFAGAIVDLSELAARRAHALRVADIATGMVARQAAEDHKSLSAELAVAKARFNDVLARALAGSR